MHAHNTREGRRTLSVLLGRSNKLRELLHTFYRRIYIKLWWRYPWLFQSPRTPHIVHLELTNDCNLACPHCARNFEDREIGYMDVHLFERIVREISSYSWCFLRIGGLGEPAMHPHIKEMLDYLADTHLKIEFITNGELLMRFRPKEILKWRIDKLDISIDGFDRASYSRHRPNGDYDTLRAKVIEFFNARTKMRAGFPKVQIRNVLFPSTTPDQIRTFTEHWLPFADAVTFITLISKCKFAAPQTFERCEDILFTINIRWDGRVPLCGYQLWCADVEWLGNLHDYSLRDLWFSERLLEVRKRHATLDFEGIEFCKHCFFTQQKKNVQENRKTYDKYRNPALSLINRLTP
jgi:sulfatase maturation enzyme AslB (radical SAM superfamily)